MRPLTKRDLEVLDDMRATNESRVKHLGAEYEWAKPMDIGAHDASYHSGVIKKLARRGLIEVKEASQKRPGCSRFYRAGCWYRITDAGRRVIAEKGRAVVKCKGCSAEIADDKEKNASRRAMGLDART